MICATRGGDGWLWYLVAVVVALFGGPERYLAIGSAALAAGAGIAFFLWAKRITGRRRPCHIQPHCWSTLLPPDQFSFPSGHTITAFAILTPLLVLYPEFTLEFMFVALSIAASRIILGMHFLSDVLVGAAAGTLLGYSALALLR
jgi:undecaprenyl-diphosphatase